MTKPIKCQECDQADGLVVVIPVKQVVEYRQHKDGQWTEPFSDSELDFDNADIICDHCRMIDDDTGYWIEEQTDNESNIPFKLVLIEDQLLGGKNA